MQFYIRVLFDCGKSTSIKLVCAVCRQAYRVTIRICALVFCQRAQKQQDKR
jgi:hypothetical protein